MKLKYKYTFIFIGLAVLIWFLNAVIYDVFFNQDSIPFISILITDIPSRELYIRIFILLYLLIFTIIIYYTQVKKETAINELASSESNIRVTLNSIGDGVIATDLDGNVTGMNPVAESHTGWLESEAIGKHITEIFTIINEKTKEKIDNPVLTVLKEFKKVNLAHDATLVSKTGKTSLIADSASPIVSYDGEFIGAVLIFRDVTSEKKIIDHLTESENRFRSIISNINEGIHLINEKGQIVEWNRALEEFTGLKKQDVLGKYNWDIQFKLLEESKKTKEKYDDLKRRTLLALKTGDRQYLNAKCIFRFEIGGKYKYFEQESFTITKENGYWLGSVIHDMTSRVEMEKALQEREESFVRIFNMSPIPTVIIKLKSGIVQDCNEAFAELSGFSKSELIGSKMNSLGWFEAGDWIGYYKNLLKKSKLTEYEIKTKRKNGEIIDILLNSSILELYGENCIVSYVQDITKRKKIIEELILSKEELNALILERTSELEQMNEALAQENQERSKIEKALRESEEKYRSMLNQLPIGVYRSTPEGKILQANPALAKIFGYDNIEELLKINADDLYVEQEVRKKLIDELSQTKDIKLQVLRLKRKDGSIIWVRDFAKAIFNDKGEIEFFDGTIEDITDKKLAEEELKNAMKYSEMIYNVTPSCIFTVDNDLIITSWNDRIAQLTGYSAKEVIGKKCNLCPEINKEKKCSIFNPYFKKPIFGEESFIITKSGERRIISKNMDLLRNTKGEIIGGIESFEDITNKKQIEKELLYQSEVNLAFAELSKALIEISTLNELSEIILDRAISLTHSDFGFIGTIDEDKQTLNVTAVSKNIDERMAKRAFNWQFEGFKGLWGYPALTKKAFFTNDAQNHPYAIKTPEWHIPLQRYISAPAMAGDKVIGLIGLANSIRDYNENDLNIIERISALFSVAMQRFQAEEDIKLALVKEQDLNDMKSRFISMVSHEYRTPLTAIVLSTEILSDYADKLSAENRKMHYDRIRQSVHTMATLIENIVQYNKIQLGKTEFNPVQFSLEQLCLSMVQELQFIAKDKVKIDLTIINGDRKVYLDEQLMRQIIFNLLSNAIKFSVKGATIEFIVEIKNNEVIMQVKDQGIGIPSQDMNRLWEPFYRARNVGAISGTGLGLSLIKNAVEVQGGTITCESEENIGTTFIVKIPFKMPKT